MLDHGGKYRLHVLGGDHVRPATSAQARAARSRPMPARGERPTREAGGAAGVRDERLNVVEQRRGDVHLEHAALQLVQCLDARHARRAN